MRMLKRIAAVSAATIFFYCGLGNCNEINISDIYSNLLIKFPEYKDKTYSEPLTNFVDPSDFILQTPDAWNISRETYDAAFVPHKGFGLDDDFNLPKCDSQIDCNFPAICKEPTFSQKKQKICLTNAHEILSQIYNAIISTHERLDLTNMYILGGMSTGAFTTTLENALAALSDKNINGNPIIVRILEGSFGFFTSSKSSEQASPYIPLEIYFKELVKKINKKSNIVIYMASEQSCFLKINCGNDYDYIDPAFSYSLNHAKTIVVDDNLLIAGGENYCDSVYLRTDPVSDLGIKIYGKIANAATNYNNIIWNYVVNNQGFMVNVCYKYSHGAISKECPNILPAIGTSEYSHVPSNEIPVRAMYVGTLNNGLGVGNSADQTEPSRIFAMRNAMKSIDISQQSFYELSYLPPFKRLFPPFKMADGENVIDAIAYAIYKNNVDVRIVISNEKTYQFGYNTYSSAKYLYESFINSIVSNFKVSIEFAKNIVNSRIKIRFIGTDGEVSQFGNHSKFWMVDDKLFYVGSANIYPEPTHEFGVIIQSNDAASLMLHDYFNPMWNSSVEAIRSN